MDNILETQSLNYEARTGFLIVLSAVSWSLWKHKNEVCFTNCDIKMLEH